MGVPMARQSLAEFLAWEEHQVDRYEFYRGEVFAMVGGTARHNRVIMNLGSRIADHLDGTGCQVFSENMKVQVDEGILYPDVVVTCGKAEAGDEQIITDPKLIIEVLSPSTMKIDLGDKAADYLQLPTLAGYLIFAQDEVKAWAYNRSGEKQFPPGPQVFAAADTAISIPALNIEFPLADVYAGIEFD